MWCKLNTFSVKALIFWEEPKGLNLTKIVSIESLIFLSGFEIYHTFSNILFPIIYAETYFKLLVCTLVEISMPSKVMLSSIVVFSCICCGLKEVWKGQIIYFLVLCCHLQVFQLFFLQVIIQGSLKFTFGLAYYFWSLACCQDLPTWLQECSCSEKFEKFSCSVDCLTFLYCHRIPWWWCIILHPINFETKH